MASLRRIPSLDSSTPHPSSNPTHCLVRHSSLPPHVVCQPEFSLRGLRRSSSLNRTSYKISPYSVDPSSFHLCTLSSKLSLCRELPLLCRAVSSHGQLDEQPLSADFSIAATERHNSSVLPITFCTRRASHVVCAASRKESIGLQSSDMEESVVYTELRQSMWRFEAPPRFLIHDDIEVKACSTHAHTHDHGSTPPSEDKKQSTQNPTLTSSVDAKGMPLSLRMLKRKRSKGRPQASSSNPCKLVADHDVPSRATSKFYDRPQVFMDVCDTASSHGRCDKPLVFRDVGDSASSHARFDKPWLFTDVGTYASSTKTDKPKFFTDVAGNSVPRAKFDKPQAFSDVSDSVSNAFVSLVYMLRMLQHHTHCVHMRFRASMDGFDRSCHEASSVSCHTVHSDMLDSFLWLFQQVFSCTPMLMLLTMILLADFMLHFMTRHVAFPVMPLGEPPTTKSFTFNAEKPIFMEGMAASDGRVDVMDLATSAQNGGEEEYKLWISSSRRGGGLNEDGSPGNGGYNAKIVSHGGGHISLYDDGRGSLSQDRTTTEDANPRGIALSSSAPLSSASLHSVHGKLGNHSRKKRIDLDCSIKHMMVAPVHAPVLETDDYPCFNRTHLTYQQEISMDPDNPLLLANYAHFLHVVRHDHGRAEELYRRAVRAGEEVDSELMGRFASFLWVAKGDVAEADMAYKAAVEADPTNAFHAGSYAHFLWNVSAEETSCGIMDAAADATTMT